MNNNLLSLEAKLAPMVITVSLRQPNQSTPLLKWTFENQPVIKIGRSSDNHVILHSSVVSRHHIELRHIATSWQLINYGTNSVYVDGKAITNVSVRDGMIIRIARSGPQLQLNLGFTDQTPRQRTLPSRNE
ncbi:MAG TPA: FHA domain-containing protein [Cyanophyceae cyanobacterium]